MDARGLNDDLVEIIKVKNKLAGIDYNDSQYDRVEDELHDKEDRLMEKYGSVLDRALKEVHAQYCPNTEILLPIAYLAKEYLVDGKDSHFDVSRDEGVLVNAPEYPGTITRLVLVPSPTRIFLQIGENSRKEVWNFDN